VLTPPAGISTVSKAEGKISGFGIKQAATGAGSEQHDSKKTAVALDDDEDDKGRLKFKELDDSELVTRGGDDIDDDDGDDLRSEDEEAEANREAAQRRAAEVQAGQDDVVMKDVEPIDGRMEEQTTRGDDVDPLDAFMATLEQSERPLGRRSASAKKQEAELFDSDDELPAMEAIGSEADIILQKPKSKKKAITPWSAAKIPHDDFRKNFYSESSEIAEMSVEEIKAIREDLVDVEVKGNDPPKPILKWSQASFPAQILDIIRVKDFDNPTPIQAQALPAIMSGRDTIGIAKTGSGKTLAYLLPMFRHIKDQPPLKNLDGPIGLILAPTRELAVQIHNECGPYTKALGLQAVCCYGGSPIADNIAALKRGAEIVVCTPGRYIDLLQANSGRVTNLNRVTYIVLDEADRMFDMGFEPQISQMLGGIRPNRQAVLFSATFPIKVETLAKKILKNPLEITAGGRSVVGPEITQVIEIREEDSKLLRLLELLGEVHLSDDDARSLVFVERQEAADDIVRKLGKNQYPATSVHGGRDQIDRDQSISDFKAGIYPVMVATSVAARGLDVKHLKLVVNWDCPNHGEDYVHRCGRTGRAGNTGTAVTFVTPDQERFSPFLVRALKDSKQDVPEPLQEMATAFKAKVKSGEAQRQRSGFGGRGIERLAAARASENARVKSQFKTDDEPADAEADAATDSKTSEIEKRVAKATGVIKARDTQPEELQLSDRLAQHLSNAMKVQKHEEKIEELPKDPLARAAAAAAAVNSRIGTRGTHCTTKMYEANEELIYNTGTRPGAPPDNHGPDAGAHYSTLEINDFPQKARWNVTNRTNVAKILEGTGVSITSKGNYYAANTRPGPGDPPPLYILVEGHTEPMVLSAMKQLADLLKAGTLAAQEQEARAGTGGRYSVV
jgi:ATP-dependent RNA helicase DDX46/PRP5